MNRRPWPLFLLLLAGCPPRVDVRSAPPPDATALLAEVDATDARVAALQSQAKAHLDARSKKGNVQMFVAVAAPASVHLEVLDFFGKPSGILISDGRRFVMLASDTGTWLRGAATAENVARVLPVSLPPEELVAMLLGRAPRLADPAPTLLVDSAENVFRVTLRAGGRTQELWVDPTHKRAVRSQVDGPGGYTLSFADFEDAVIYEAARYVDAQAIVTRNTRDFKPSAMPIHQPSELLHILQANRDTGA